MVLWRFLKEQNWKYGVPCIFFLACITGYIDLLPDNFSRESYLAYQFICATGFLICYSLKFADKHNNLFIDQFKLIFYFVFFTGLILSLNVSYIRNLLIVLLPLFLLYLYFYSVLNFYITEMEEKGKSIRKSFLYIFVVLQSIMFVGVIIWAITQKVEAEKQKVLALAAKEAAIKAQYSAKKAEDNAKEAHQLSLIAKDEAEKYKNLYDSLSKK